MTRQAGSVCTQYGLGQPPRVGGSRRPDTQNYDDEYVGDGDHDDDYYCDDDEYDDDDDVVSPHF